MRRYIKSYIAWKRMHRQQERAQAKQAIREGREPQRYRRPYFG